ncbi:MAG: glycogen synthase GlgA [Candidatus Riflebacteria bacterium]|nr:glycogen synthase GlgA [Candidatus Riflebacteria bacterium]
MSLKILFATSEYAPYAKTGGLADVGAALPRAMDALGHGHDVRIVMPFYGCVPRDGVDHLLEFPVPIGGGRENAVIRWKSLGGGLPLLFVQNGRFFDRPGIYGEGGHEYGDSPLRFGFFARAVVEYCWRTGWFPDVIHVNDWQTGLVPVFLRTLEWIEPKFSRVATVCTIHNLAYQGNFDRWVLGQLTLPQDLFDSRYLEFHGAVSYLKASIVFADKITTVSPRYAQEIQSGQYGCQLDGVLRERAPDLVGILNGIDTEVWNPATDPHCWGFHYSERDFSAKARIKQRLLADFGMPFDPATPLLGVISRLAAQKGFDLIEQAVHQLAQRGVQMIFLGTGDPAFENMLRWLSNLYPGRVNCYIGFSDVLAHRIEAGADMFLMPSLYEPCGLNQMISLRYGTVPIVRRTGGLADSVIDTSEGSAGTGFVFDHYDANAILWAVGRAVDTYHDRPRWKRLVQRCMKQDFSWQRSALHYETMYEWATAERAEGRRGRFSRG